MLLASQRRWSCKVLSARCNRLFSTAATSVTANDKQYNLPLPMRPVVGICLDGAAQEYFDEAGKAGLMPNWSALTTSRHGEFAGARGLAATLMPTFTNPNNVGIMTGVPSSVHGICGNYFFDEETQQETMMNDARYLRAESIFAKLHATGTYIRVITAKDKLLRLLNAGLPDKSESALCISVEKAASGESAAKLAAVGVPDLLALMDGQRPPDIYDPMISIYGIKLGLRLMCRDLARNASLPAPQRRPLLYYLSTTDLVQHKNAPGEPVANEFFAHVDRLLGELHKAGAAVALSADHGMNQKTRFNGSPRVVYAQSVLQQAGFAGARVILPITDPYVLHHGALGGYAVVHLSREDRGSPARVLAAMQLLRAQDGIYNAFGRDDACRAFELPPDRVGDIVLVGDRNTAIGRTPQHHDFANVPRLRTHGSLDENTVPFWVSRPLLPEYAKRLTTGKARNFHLYDFLLNGLRPPAGSAMPILA